MPPPADPAGPPPKDAGALRIAKNAAVLMALTSASRLAGLVRDFCITHFFGATGLTDVFYVAFTFPNVMRRLVAEGALTVTFQPDYLAVRARDGDAAARRFAAAVFGFASVAVAVVVVAGVAAAPVLVRMFATGFDDARLDHAAALTRQLLPVVLPMALVAVAMALLNAHDVYGAPAAAPAVLNVSIIAATVAGALWLPDPIDGVVAGVVAGAVLQLAVQVPPLVRRGLLIVPAFGAAAWADARVRATLSAMLPGLFTLAVAQVNVIVLRGIASYLPEGNVSYYYTADRLLELTNGVFALAVAQGAFTSMSAAAAAGDTARLISVWRFSFKLQNLIAIPAAVGLFAIAQPIVAVLFLHGKFTWADVEATSACVAAGSTGLVATATVRGTAQVFYATGARRTPFWIAIGVVVVNAAGGVAALRLGAGIAGLAAVLAAANVLHALALVVALRVKLGALGLADVAGAALGKSALAAAAGAAALAASQLGVWTAGSTPKNAVVLAAAIGLAVVVYGAGCLVVRFEGVDVVMRRRRGGRGQR